MSLIFLLLFLSSCIFSLLSATVADDGAVLLKIKEQLGNPDVLSSWVEGFDFCNGAGNVDGSVYISCTGNGHVNRFSFGSVSANNVPFPQAICNLTELEGIYMALVYGMYGPLPSCINNLIHLQYFSMNRMPSFSTSIPEFLNNKNLTSIIFYKSGVYGSIPPSLSSSSLPKLQRLDLSWNRVNGNIPWELAHNPPPFLYLNDNYMSGELPRCATWKNLLGISLSHNWFTGDASSLFGKEKTVTSIDLSFNQFEFDISNVEAPQNLTYLDLSYNRIYGNVPESIANNPGLSLNLISNIPCADNSTGTYQPHACLCGNPSRQLPPCPVLAPPPAH